MSDPSRPSGYAGKRLNYDYTRFNPYADCWLVLDPFETRWDHLCKAAGTDAFFLVDGVVRTGRDRRPAFLVDRRRFTLWRLFKIAGAIARQTGENRFVVLADIYIGEGLLVSMEAFWLGYDPDEGRRFFADLYPAEGGVY